MPENKIIVKFNQNQPLSEIYAIIDKALQEQGLSMDYLFQECLYVGCKEPLFDYEQWCYLFVSNCFKPLGYGQWEMVNAK